MEKKLLPLFVIILFAFLLYSSGCKEDNVTPSVPEIVYDIRGSWNFSLSIAGEENTATITFTGTINTGTVMLTGFSDDVFQAVAGTYTASDADVNFKFPIPDADNLGEEAVFWGTFENQDKMSGQWTAPDWEDILGTWTAQK
jgi:hypothetical protein